MDIQEVSEAKDLEDTVRLTLIRLNGSKANILTNVFLKLIGHGHHHHHHRGFGGGFGQGGGLYNGFGGG